MSSPSHASALVRVAVTYVVALGLATAWLCLGPDTRWLWLDALIADLIATLVVFVASRLHANSSFYDAYWSVLPPYLAVYWWIASDTPVDDLRAWLVLTVVVLWSVRLTGNWAYSFTGLHHEDWRYPMLKQRGRASGGAAGELVVDLFAIHVIPTLQVFCGTLPVYAVLVLGGRDVSWLDAVALAVGLGAVAIECIADVQMHRFARDRVHGEVMRRGLWGWSRHPNYFGEISFWFSLALFGIAARPDDWWWLLSGTAVMIALFLGASIPMMEKRSLERRPSYQEVIDTVPMLVPRPPRRTP